MKLLPTALALCSILSPAAQAQTAVYDDAARTLTLPAVRLGLTTFTNLVLRLDAVGIVSVDPLAGTVADKCVVANFSADKYNAITVGMTLDQVNQLMGCRNTPARTTRSTSGYTTYEWTDQATEIGYLYTRMKVYFDTPGQKVKQFSIGTTNYPLVSGEGF